MIGQQVRRAAWPKASVLRSGGASPPDVLCCSSRAPMELLAEVGPRHAEALGAVQAERFREVWKVTYRSKGAAGKCDG